MELDAGGQALENHTGELEAELKKKEEVVNRMKAQLDTLEEEKRKLNVELEEARETLRLVGVAVETTSNGTTASEGNIFSKFWGGKGALGSGIGGRRALGDPREPDGLEGMWGYVRGWFEKCMWVPCRVLRVVMRVAQAIVDVYHIVADSWKIGMKWSALLERRAKWVAMFI